MDHQNVKAAEKNDRSNPFLTTVASLLVGAAFLSLWFWLLPRWFHLDVNLSGVDAWRWIAAWLTAARPR